MSTMSTRTARAAKTARTATRARCWFPPALAVIALVLSGCASHEPPAAAEMDLSYPVWTEDGLYLVQHDGPGALFLPPQPGLERYSALFVEDIQLGFKPGVPDFEPREAQRLVSMVRRNVLRFLASNGWERAYQPGPGTLRMRIAISDIDVQPTIIRGSGSAVFRPSGGASITLELRDSMNAQRVFLYGQRRQLPHGRYGGPGHIEAERVADAFYEYAKDLVYFVDKAGKGEFHAPRKRAAIAR